jgi:lipopolysaccharide/colanic/teichoic acid biosynthesis glycosyltransferase
MQLDPAMLERVRRNDAEIAPSPSRLEPKLPYYRELHPSERFIKRGLDIVLATLSLLLFGLILPLIALAIKLDSRGPVFYHQVRVGINRREADRRSRVRSAVRDEGERRHPASRQDRRKIVAEGRPFTIHKLRTMYVNSESDGVRWAQKHDPRITRVGRFLRQTRLDEFPQFWNVLKGDMSVVGPRPERPPFITYLGSEVPGYLQRLQFKPGITGLAQVENGYDEGLESVQRKVELDHRYMRSFSLSNDLKILWRSVAVVFTGRGAF